MKFLKKKTPEEKSASKSRKRKTLFWWGRRNQLIIILNIILVVVGLLVFVLGVVYEVLMGRSSPFLDDRMHIPPSMMVSVGVVIAFAGGLAIWGALVGSYAKMYTSAVLLMFFLMLQLIAASTAMHQREDETLIRSSKLYIFTLNYDKYRKEIDHLQNSLKCCGYKGVIPRENSSKYSRIASSCCETQDPCRKLAEDRHRQDCGKALKGFVWAYGTVIFAVTMIFAPYEIATMLCDCFVGGAWRDKKLIKEAARAQKESMGW